jgi:hypothetical protein
MILIVSDCRSSKGDLHAEALQPDRDEVALEREREPAHLQLEDAGVCGQYDSGGLLSTVPYRMTQPDMHISHSHQVQSSQAHPRGSSSSVY